MRPLTIASFRYRLAGVSLHPWILHVCPLLGIANVAIPYISQKAWPTQCSRLDEHAKRGQSIRSQNSARRPARPRCGTKFSGGGSHRSTLVSKNVIVWLFGHGPFWHVDGFLRCQHCLQEASVESPFIGRTRRFRNFQRGSKSTISFFTYGPRLCALTIRSFTCGHNGACHPTIGCSTYGILGRGQMEDFETCPRGLGGLWVAPKPRPQDGRAQRVLNSVKARWAC